MTELNYDDAPFAVRRDLTAAHLATWDRLSSAGTWLTGETRVAISAEVRNVKECSLCAARKDALSPYAVDGDHDSLGDLPENIVEVIHRIASDPGRLTQKWYRNCLSCGLSEEEYVEIVGVICSTVSVDTFAHAAGLERRELPQARPGEPTRVRPSEASQGSAWVPWIGPDDAWGSEISHFGPNVSNVRRALSLVPDEAIGFLSMVGAQYLNGDQMFDFSTEYRAITHAQIELIAGRISAINQCAY